MDDREAYFVLIAATSTLTISDPLPLLSSPRIGPL